MEYRLRVFEISSAIASVSRHKLCLRCQCSTHVVKSPRAQRLHPRSNEARAVRGDGERKIFRDDPGLKGLWGEEATLETCRTELESTLEDWIALRLRFGDRLPVIGGINLHAKADEDDAKWLKQMEEDAASGKLDFLFEEADRAEKAGDLLDWPANE